MFTRLSCRSWIGLYTLAYEERVCDLFSFASVSCRPNCRPRDLLKAGEVATVLIRHSHSPRNIRYYSPLRPHCELSRNKSRVPWTATNEPDKLFPADFSLLVFTKLRFPAVFARSFRAFPLRVFVCRLIKCVSVCSLWRSLRANAFHRHRKMTGLWRNRIDWFWIELQSSLDDTQCRKFFSRKFDIL